MAYPDAALKLSDFSDAFRPAGWRHLALGLGHLLLLVVGVVDLLIGVQLGGLLGTFLAVSAIYMSSRSGDSASAAGRSCSTPCAVTSL